YVCNCNSGRRVVGCCVHVATAIIYLSYIRYSSFKIPAENFSKIFHDKNSNRSPNRRQYVRNNRTCFKKILFNNECAPKMPLIALLEGQETLSETLKNEKEAKNKEAKLEKEIQNNDLFNNDAKSLDTINNVPVQQDLSQN
ncbi:unnamed protein product, partial [Brachionus calyciflorus]